MLFIAVAVSAFSIFPTNASAALPGSDILLRIREQAGNVYSKYTGVESQREIKSFQYNAKTGGLISSNEVTMIRKEYFHKKAEYIVLKYIKDGKLLPPKNYNYKTRDPLIMPFDPGSNGNYIIKLNGEVEVTGKRCYEVDVLPKIKTSRTLCGKMYFTVDNLEPYYLEGTIARYPVGLESLRFQIYFKKVGDAWVMSHGTYTFVIHIPVFYPHRKFVSQFVSTNDQLIPLKK